MIKAELFMSNGTRTSGTMIKASNTKKQLMLLVFNAEIQHTTVIMDEKNSIIRKEDSFTSIGRGQTQPLFSLKAQTRTKANFRSQNISQKHQVCLKLD